MFSWLSDEVGNEARDFAGRVLARCFDSAERLGCVRELVPVTPGNRDGGTLCLSQCGGGTKRGGRPARRRGPSKRIRLSGEETDNQLDDLGQSFCGLGHQKEQWSQ
ncbi:hypothetical protein [Leptolyngbya sp. FACHB-261]|uniref:hypothetical protein n=1 Tax=Leptolyngbya sp. FACHB-261 TaxID=2692806 RepID=UPI0016825733|nr:hypothetical protein [Leptolyngbya sp. FACHB-261]MBD2100942.1 hypothetical protein [Leptolyngbya sp. FACHB-261]